ncbi:hypothetical protein FGW37_09325 [Streptomyces rectiverticillatus]|uniref:hypothetical protein n=1 Tax=Streptomyces rectiverticillatus TaxID=173860 RepID=UPI0015C3A25D|nr:hypothetical protein [Streptomyces rectiverticillatus]QLE71781.1 hypothetical protein FGW37_09325 [Streptomyces rectiverticillatus]
MSRFIPWPRRSTPAEEPPAPPAWTYTFTDRPASSDPTLRFTAQVHVTWRAGRSGGIGAQHDAARLVRGIVDKAAGSCDVLRSDAAEQDINAALRAQLPLSGYGVEVLDSHIRLTIDDSTQKAALLAERMRQGYALEETRRRREQERDDARRREERTREEDRLHREYELDALARRQARARADFLRTEILANPASARLYTLLERYTEHWPRLGGPPAGTSLPDLVREVQQWQPQVRWVAVAQLLHDFVAGLTEEGRKELLTILAKAVQVHGDERTAQALIKAAGERE